MTTALERAGMFVEEHAGLRASAATEMRLATSLQQRATVRGLEVDEYVARLSIDVDERQALLDLVTVQETSFFRDEGQLDALVRHIIPRMRAPIVVWSAGCATGQEPYSLAMALHETGVKDWWVVASDLSVHACARTRAAYYDEAELRGLSPARVGRYLRPVEAGWEIVPELRERVTVVHHNVANDLPPVGRAECAAIFCRNVFIYLSRERVHVCLDRIRERLRPGGALFLGGSETLGYDDRFDAVRMGDVFAYVRADPAPCPAAPPRRDVVVTARPSTPLPDGADLRRSGEAAARMGLHADAATAFRRAVYLDQDDVAAHLGLAFSLEALGHTIASRRAFAAAQAALDRADDARVTAALEGYGAETVRVVLASKLGDIRRTT